MSAVSPVIAGAEPLEGTQLNIKTPVPPEAETDAAPLFPPLQDILVWETEETEIAVGSEILNV